MYNKIFPRSFSLTLTRRFVAALTSPPPRSLGARAKTSHRRGSVERGERNRQQFVGLTITLYFRTFLPVGTIVPPHEERSGPRSSPGKPRAGPPLARAVEERLARAGVPAVLRGSASDHIVGLGGEGLGRPLGRRALGEADSTIRRGSRPRERPVLEEKRELGTEEERRSGRPFARCFVPFTAVPLASAAATSAVRPRAAGTGRCAWRSRAGTARAGRPRCRRAT